MAETSNRAKTAPQASRRSPSSTGGAPQLTVSYWKRMRPNKVYPVFVTSSGGGDMAPVTLRLVVAGAQVVPAELEFDPTSSREKVTFYVTPIAKNGLRGEKLEVLRDGIKIQELRLPSKVCTQGSTWGWLVLAILLPWLILHYLVYSPIGYEAPLNFEGIHKYEGKEASANYGKVVEGDDAKKEKKKDEIDPRPGRIKSFVQENTPDLGSMLDSQDLKDSYQDVQTFPMRVYVRMVQGYRDLNQPLAFYLFLLFLFLALVSWFYRREAKKTVRGRPLPAGGE